MGVTVGLSIAVGVLSLLCAFLLLFIWSAKRHRDPTLRFESDQPIEALMPSLAGLCLDAPVEGNSVEVLENGAFFDALVEAIGAARRTVHLETFLWKDGALGRRVADALCERARAGLRVRVLVDAIGCSEMGEEVRRRMTDAGCRVEKFHEWSWRNVGVMNDRNHRKLAVLDGSLAFVGGHCIVDQWLGDAEDGEHCADVSVKVRGPIVARIQSAFSENWVGETGELPVGEDVFPELARAGDVTMHAAFLKPERSAPAVKILHHTAICLARRRIWIQNPYFIPDAEAIGALGAAVRRGVDVRVMMPSTGGSDNPMVQHAGHYNFEKLLRLGVRLLEYPHTLLHQKAMVVDGTWSAVGSSNFDSRSFEINDEITLSILDPACARRLEAIFERYAPRCLEITVENWRQRGRWHRVIDGLCYAIHEVL